MMFTFLFLTLGPLKIIQRFAVLTRGQDVVVRRKLAVTSSIVALVAAVLATTIGAKILMTWHISRGAIVLTAGVLLFLVALQGIMSQYGVKPDPVDPDAPPPSATQLAFSPLAFPTIVTPYGIALLIVLATISHGQLLHILGLTTAIFVINLLTMLGAARIMKWPLAVAVLGILGAIMGVLQVALGIQAMVNGLHFLGVGT
jgi:multiple antibiotic resistance protein